MQTKFLESDLLYMKRHTYRRFPGILVVCLFLMVPKIIFAQDRGFSDEGSVRHFGRDRVYDIQHIKLELSFDQPRKTVYGNATLTVTPINDGMRRMDLDGVDLEIESVTVNNGKQLNYSANNEKLRIDLDRPYNEDEVFEIVIRYQAQPRLGLYFIQPDDDYPDKPWQIWSQGEMEENRFWFPSYDFPNDRMTSEMIVTVPAGQMAISNGELVEATENKDNTTTYHWKENIPHANYLTSLVVGEFVEIKDEWDGIPVVYYVEPQDSAKALRSFGKTPDMVRFFSEKIGIRYPYEKYAQTTIRSFMWGGMENISATTLTRNTLHDARAHLDNTSDGLVAHELAHQWWGDLLTCKNWNHVWLNEAFATYFDALYVEHAQGEDEYLMEMEGNRDRYLGEDSSEYRRPIVYNLYEDPDQMFDRHTYQKGAWVLQMIRYVLGDELWWKAIHHYGEKFDGYTVETNDFREAIEEATGRSLEWLFDEWLYRGGYPEYLVSWDWNPDSGSVFLTVKQTQHVDEVTPLFRMPVEIEISGESGSRVFVVEIQNEEETFEFQFPSKPLRVEFDPREQILKQLAFIKTKEELLNQLRYSNHTAGKIRAAKSLEKFIDQGDVLDALAHALATEKSWGIRSQAARTLGKIDNRRSRDALITALRDKQSKVRIEAIKSLGQFADDKRVETALLNIFEKDSSYYAQAEAVRSLAKINSSRATDVCERALLTDSHDEVIRKAAFDGFIRLKDPGGLDHALSWSARGRRDRARAEAIRAMGKLAKYNEDRLGEIYSTLMEYLHEDNFRIRQGAARALADVGNPDAIPELMKIEADQYHFRWKQIYRKAIKKIRHKMAMRQSPDPGIESNPD